MNARRWPTPRVNPGILPKDARLHGRSIATRAPTPATLTAMRRFAVPALALITLLTLFSAQARTMQVRDEAHRSADSVVAASAAQGTGVRDDVQRSAVSVGARRAAREAGGVERAAREAGGVERGTTPPPADAGPQGGAATGRAPSIGGVPRRESALASRLRLDTYSEMVYEFGPIRISLFVAILLALLVAAARWWFSPEMLLTVLYTALYLTASPMAIMANKILMKDKGFGYPVLVSALGQTTSAVCATIAVHITGETLDNGRRIGYKTLGVLGCVSALSLVLGQYPYFYLTVAFIQMLKAFSPAYMIVFLFCLGIEKPSRRVIGCVMGLCLCTAVASAGEVNFSVVGVLFMTAASCSDALRLVIAQKLLNNQKMMPFEALVWVSPMCLLFMAPVAVFKELPAAHAAGSIQILYDYPWLFIASGFSGFFVNIASFLLVKRCAAS